MVVEDQESMRMVLLEVLEQSGFEVDAVENGRQALDGLESRRPDIITTDLVMPVLDGLQLARVLTDEAGERPLPLVLVSERLFDFPPEVEVERYFDGVVPKPVDPTVLIRTIRELLEEK